MSTNVKVLVLRAAGINCDKETVFAFEQAGAKVDLVHINALRESPAVLNNYQILVFPGGFSFGDDISAGKIYSVRLRHELGEQLGEFVQSDKLILGICNGFQILVKAGLLPDPSLKGDYTQTVTLSDNDSGKFEDRWVWLKSYSKKCVFTDPGEMIYIPIAHGEGKFIPQNKEVLAQLQANDQIVFRYVDEKGRIWRISGESERLDRSYCGDLRPQRADSWADAAPGTAHSDDSGTALDARCG